MPGRLICDDCVASMPRLDRASARLVIADPPYFNVLQEEAWDTSWSTEDEYLDWTLQWVEAAMQTLMPGGLLYCFGQVGKREHVFLHLMSNVTKRFQFHDLVVWDRVVGYNDRKDSWTPAYEMALVLRQQGGGVFFDKDAVREPYDEKTIQTYLRDKRYKDMAARLKHLMKGKFATNLWRIPSLKGSGHEKVGHPAQKPEALIERIIKSSSKAGDLIIDPFLGSGTTAVVAQNLDRNWIGIERNIEYFEMSRRRLGEYADYIVDYAGATDVEQAMQNNLLRRPR